MERLDPRRSPFVGALAPGLVYAALMALVFPPVSMWGLAFATALPLVWLADRTERGAPSALAVTLMSLPMWWLHHRWIADISAAGLPALVLYLSLWPGLLVWMLSAVTHRLPRAPLWIVAPTVWVALETLRGEVVWHGYAWFLVGHPVIEWTGFAAFASVGGVYLVSWLVVAPSGLALDLAHWLTTRGEEDARPWGAWVAFGALTVVGAGLIGLADGVAPPPAEGAGRVRVALVETQLPQSNKMAWPIEDRLARLERWAGLTMQAGAVPQRPDLIVWPETMFPGRTLEPSAVAVERASGLGYPSVGLGLADLADGVTRLQGAVGVPMVVGAIGIDGLAFEEAPGGGIEALAEATHNSAFLIRDGQVDPLRYDKIHLTPFGEVMPYISAWPWLERRLLDLGARGMSFDLDAGRRAERLEVPAGPGVAPWRPRELVGAAADAPAQTQAGSTLMIATPICFEVTSSVVCRRLVYEDGARAADLIVQLTNDGWFGASAGGRLTHLLTARWRAVELGVPLVRAANTGISAAVDARGRVFARTDASPGSPDPTDDGRLLVVDAELPPPGAPTPFARIGNLVGWASVLGSAATLVVAGFIGRVESRAASEAWMRPAEGGKDQRPGTERLRAARRGPGAGVERPRGGGDAPPAPDAPEDGA